ncbi:MAG: citramalate synthase [Deltaproteobacteria bacterium]|nr:citramalate synthase [Deltaproteobacteria bacterium]
MNATNVLLYDTTLRDGTQGEQVNLSLEDKLKIARRLDDMGFDYIEGGWPGSNPKDQRFFQLAREMQFKHAKIAAFGSTRKPAVAVENCPNVQALLEADTGTVTIVGKTWDLHATDILGVSLDENIRMIEETIGFLKERGKEVVFDAEHFFDGFKNNRTYALAAIRAAHDAGADYTVLCDTNGGSLPWEVEHIATDAAAVVPVQRLGIHTHNDCGLAVANSLAALRCGVRMVQGTVNGFGERCGNADLTTVVGCLALKMERPCLPQESIKNLTAFSRYVSDVANVPPLRSRPFVGVSAFAHKGGVHVSAIAKNPRAYEQMDPSLVGNKRRVLVSDLSGKSTIKYKAEEMGLDLGDGAAAVVADIKRLEDQGYQFEAAGGSLELLMRRHGGLFREPFKLESFSVMDQRAGEGASRSQATIKISVGSEDEIAAAEGNGPVNALDSALRKALLKFFPGVKELGLVDFKVSILEGSDGTAAKVRVFIESRDKADVWTTVGVSTNIIEASWIALADSFIYKILKDEGRS